MAGQDCTIRRSAVQALGASHPGLARFLRFMVNAMAKKSDAMQGRLGRETADRLPVAGATWQVWTADEDEDRAAETFARRHGSHPEHVVDCNGYLWLGPVPGLEVTP